MWRFAGLLIFLCLVIVSIVGTAEFKNDTACKMCTICIWIAFIDLCTAISLLRVSMWVGYGLDQQNRALEAATVTLRYFTALCPPMGKMREIFDLHFLQNQDSYRQIIVMSQK